MTKNENVPELRFPGFEGKWESKSIGGVFSIFNGYAFSSSDSVPSGVRWVKIADVGIQEMKDDSVSYLPDEYSQRYPNFLLKKGEYVIALTRPILNRKLKIAKVNTAFDGALLNQRVGKLVSKQNLAFIYYTLQRSWLIDRIEKNILGTEPPNLSINQIKTLMVGIPTKDEQQKIADFLSAVDKKIEQLTEKHRLLTEYKKGVMQQIFSQQIRFKDDEGNEYPEWEEKELGSIAQITMGTSPNSVSYNEQDNGLPLIQGNADISNRVSSPRIFTSIITKECFVGDVLLSVRAPVGEVSRSLHHACIGRGMSAIKARKNNSTEFIYQFLLWFEPRWRSLSQGSTFESVNTKEIKELRVVTPCEGEQQKIANFLTAIDNKIDQAWSKLEQTKAFKKGLLQKMFV